MQQTLILFKPDCINTPADRRGSWIGLNAKVGLAGMKLVQASQKLAQDHYAVHKGKPFYDSLVSFITGGPTLAMVWEGREAVAVGRSLIGATDGVKAAPGTIRGDFGLSVQNNLVHGSDSPENAASEIKLWFRPEELISYASVDGSWIQ